jgi:flagella basal body P-ring formation protein FlgA
MLALAFAAPAGADNLTVPANTGDTTVPVHADGAAAAIAELPAQIERAARVHLLELARTADLHRVSVNVTAVSREVPPDCASGVRIEAVDTRHFSRMRFAVVCAGTAPWRLESIVRARLTAEVVVAVSDLRAGAPIEPQALALERREIPAIDAAVSDPASVDGKASRRALRQGQIVDPRWLIEPLLVRRGAAVEIVARHPGVAVRVAGEAMEAGRRMQVIPVRNTTNGAVIQARVIGPNQVEVVRMESPASLERPAEPDEANTATSRRSR